MDDRIREYRKSIRALSGSGPIRSGRHGVGRFALAIVLGLTAFVSATRITQGGPGDRRSDPFAGFRIVDLTHSLDSEIPVYPGGVPYQSETMATIDRGYYHNKFSTGEHVGTHVDAPSHFARGGLDVDRIEPERLFGPLVVLDVSRAAQSTPDYEVGVADVEAWERRHGSLPPGAFVVARTGWGARWKDPARYVNRDERGVLHFPGFSAEAAEFLLQRRDIRGVGIDTLSADPGRCTRFPEHRMMLTSGRINVENLDNLDALPESGAYLILAPLKLARGSGAPARAFALVPRSSP